MDTGALEPWFHTFRGIGRRFFWTGLSAGGLFLTVIMVPAGTTKACDVLGAEPDMPFVDESIGKTSHDNWFAFHIPESSSSSPSATPSFSSRDS